MKRAIVLSRLFSKFIFLCLFSMALFSCGKKNISSSIQEDWREKSSKEIEVSYNMPVEASNDIVASQPHLTDESKTASDNNVSNNYFSNSGFKAGKLFSSAEAKDRSGIKKASNEPSRIQKVSLLKKLVKGRSGLNQKLLIGLILLGIGILVAIVFSFGGALAPLAWIGNIIAVVGIVFIILGLVEMM